MTRGEEIHKAAEEFAFSDKTETPNFHDVINDFYYGAKWADEHPNLYNDEKYHTVRVSDLDKLYRKAEMYDTFLEKACEWWEQRQGDYDLYDVWCGDYVSIKHVIMEFREAMEK